MIFVLILFSCNQNVEKKITPENTLKTNYNNTEPNVAEKTWIESFKEFRNAIYNRDKIKVKTFISFPIYNENNEIWFLENIQNEQLVKNLSDQITPFPETEFDKHYDDIFSRYFVNSILKIKTDILFSKGEYETIQLKDKQTKYKIYASVNKKKNEIILNLATETAIEVNDRENEIIENSEYNVIYYFKIEEDKTIKFKQVRIAG